MYYYHTHFKVEDTKAQIGEGTWPRPHSQQVVELGFEPGLFSQAQMLYHLAVSLRTPDGKVLYTYDAKHFEICCLLQI